MGWAGDTHIFCHTALQNSNLKEFYERNIQAMQDLQTKEGRYPEIAPIGGGFGGITYECAPIFLAWELFRQYGDIRTLECFYPGMQKYMNYMEQKGLPGRGKMQEIGPLGDWLACDETDLQLLWNAFYFREAYIMAEISKVLGKKDEISRYQSLADRCREFWNKIFIDPQTGKTRDMDGNLCDTQCSYALGIEYGLVDDQKTVARHLRRKVRESGYTVRTGWRGKN